jgi:small subunit ribosomal protein S20
MPVLKHAKKKLRQDVKREQANKSIKTMFKKLLKQAKANPNKETFSKAYSALDKAAKNHVIHANKASRLKSTLAKATDTKAAAPTKTALPKATTKSAKSKATKASAKAKGKTSKKAAK